MRLYWSLLIPIGLYVSLWISMGAYAALYIFIRFDGLQSVLKGPYRSLFVLMDSNGFV